MDNKNKNPEENSNQDFISDYEKIIHFSENAVIVKTEWSKNGDFFQKLSMYDSSYAPVTTFGSTTLIKAL